MTHESANAVTRFPILILGCLALIGCQTAPPINLGGDAAWAGDKNLIVNGCDLSLNRGVEVCRFVRGSKIESRANIVIPWMAGGSNAEVKVRFKDRVKSFKATGPLFDFSYSDLLGASVWDATHDGPIQVMTTTKNIKGESLKGLGYIYLVILKPGYSPDPIFPDHIGTEELVCRARHDPKGRSSLECANAWPP